MRRPGARGMTTLEFCVLMTVVIAAVAAMWRPIVGAIEGRWKQAGDGLGNGLQYEPNRTTIQ